MTAKLLYFADPMCSWCYGFAPQISQVESEHPDLDFQLVMGGLRPFGRETMAEIGYILKHHWEEVNARSGQPFAHAILKNTAFVYDTEPPSRAVVAMRTLNPAGEFSFFKAVQEAFYRDNADTNDPETYLELSRAYDIGGQDFLAAFDSEPVRNRTLEDFAYAKELGVSGFPTTILQLGERFFLLSHGYAEAGQLTEAMEKVFALESY
jgi:putative protein-disulfide isomerase